MKFKFLNESGEIRQDDEYELWLSESIREPHMDFDPKYYFETKPLKAALMKLSDPLEMEDAVNRYSKTRNAYRYAGTKEFNGVTFFKFDHGTDYRAGSAILWYCQDVSNGLYAKRIRREIPKGSILVSVFETGFSEVYYSFYRVEKYQDMNVVLSELEKIRSDKSPEPYVMPGHKAVSANTYKICINDHNMKPYVELQRDDYLDFDKSVLYKPSKQYQEDLSGDDYFY